MNNCGYINSFVGLASVGDFVLIEEDICKFDAYFSKVYNHVVPAPGYRFELIKYNKYKPVKVTYPIAKTVMFTIENEEQGNSLSAFRFLQGIKNEVVD